MHTSNNSQAKQFEFMEQINTPETENAVEPATAETTRKNKLPTLTTWQFSTLFIPYFERLENDEQRGIMIRALYTYAFTGEELPIADPRTHAVFFFALQDIDKQRRKVAELSIARSNAGKAGNQALRKKQADAERRKAKRLAKKLAEQGTTTDPETASQPTQS